MSSSSNKHWPSLFRSKPSASNQRHHDSSSSLSGGGAEERTPEPKPRWNPKPEQIRILESLFNSGVVNPSREEIRRIRIRLEEYGEVGDANVFYWFQNRKSRSKNKQRQLQIQNAMAAAVVVEPQQNPSPPPPPPPPAVTFLGNNSIMIGTSSSSSSSDNSSDHHRGIPFFTNSPSSVNQQQQQTLYQTTPPPNDLLPEPYFYPQPPNSSGGASFTQGFFFPDAPAVPLSSDLTIGNSSGILPTELMGFNPPLSKGYDNEGINLDLGYGTVTSLPTTTVTATNAPLSLLPPPSTTVPSTLYHFQGLGDAGVEPQKATLLVNGIPFEVAAAAFDVRGTFGDEAVLVHCYSGQPLATNEWGVTVHPLQPGAVYYLI